MPISRTGLITIAAALATILLAACGNPPAPPAWQGSVCRFQQGLLGNVVIITDNEALKHNWRGWHREATVRCPERPPSHLMDSGGEYWFVDGRLHYAASDTTTPLTLQQPAWPQFVDMMFRLSWSGLTIQGMYMPGYPLYAYGLGADGTIWQIRLDDAGRVAGTAPAAELDAGWSPVAIDVPRHRRVAVLARNGTENRVFQFRLQ